MAKQTFAADIAKYGAKVMRNMKAVAGAAIQDVVEPIQTEAQLGRVRGGSPDQGHLPIGNTNDLQNSLVTSINGADAGTGASSYSVGIAGFEVGDVLRFNWNVEYSLAMELGFSAADGTQLFEGYHFVGLNAAKFSDHFDRRAKEIG